MVQGQVFLKGGRGGGGEEEGDTFPISFFQSFIIFTFRTYFTFCRIMLSILRKIIFFYNHNFMKKGHSKLSKNEPENIP